MVKINYCSSNWASEWEGKVIYITEHGMIVEARQAGLSILKIC